MKQNDTWWNLQNFIFWKDKINYNKIIMSTKKSGGKGFFFIFPLFPMCFHYVPSKFPMGSHQILNMFPNMFSVAPHFYPICFYQMLLSSFHL
jgi:hypothetical protein